MRLMLFPQYPTAALSGNQRPQHSRPPGRSRRRYPSAFLGKRRRSWGPSQRRFRWQACPGRMERLALRMVRLYTPTGDQGSIKPKKRARKASHKPVLARCNALKPMPLKGFLWSDQSSLLLVVDAKQLIRQIKLERAFSSAIGSREHPEARHHA
jgi:hypothetical protein